MDFLSNLVTGVLEQVFQGGTLTEILKILKIDFSAYWNNTTIMNVINNAFITIGILMVIIYFTGDIIDKIQLQQSSYEYFFKTTLKMLLAVYIINNCVQIYSDINKINITLAEQVRIEMNKTGIATENKDKNGKTIEAFDVSKVIKEVDAISKEDTGFNVFKYIGNFAALIGYTLWSFILMIAYTAIQLVIYWVCFSRLLKMYLYATFAPIGMSDMMSGMNSKGVRYLKSYLALCFQGIVILIIGYASNIITNLIYNTFYPNYAGKSIPVEFTPKLLLAYILGQLVIAMAITRSEQMSKEIIGV